MAKPAHWIAPVCYPATLEGSTSGMPDAALTEHIVAQVTSALTRANADHRTLVAVTCVGSMGMHVHEDPRTAQVVARAVCRVHADLALIMAEANDSARVVMDCGMRVAIDICRIFAGPVIAASRSPGD